MAGTRRKRKEGTLLKGKGFGVCVDAELLFASLPFTGGIVSWLPASPGPVLPPSREGRGCPALKESSAAAWDSGFLTPFKASPGTAHNHVDVATPSGGLCPFTGTDLQSTAQHSCPQCAYNPGPLLLHGRGSVSHGDLRGEPRCQYHRPMQGALSQKHRPTCNTTDVMSSPVIHYTHTQPPSPANSPQ